LPTLYIKNSIQRVESSDIAVLKKHGIQISILKREKPDELITAISAMIESIYQLINVGKQIGADAIIKLSEMIIENYWYLKIDEIDLVFKNGITGKYGKIYDRVDASVIFDWLHKYDTSQECISIYEENSNPEAVAIADEDLKRPGNWSPSGIRQKEHHSSILENAEFKERLMQAGVIGEIQKVEPITDEDHKENVRLQAEQTLKNPELKKEAEKLKKDNDKQ